MKGLLCSLMVCALATAAIGASHHFQGLGKDTVYPAHLDALETTSPGTSELEDLDMIFVAGDEVSGGPTYGFRIQRFETTNEQFLLFLNDALCNRGTVRGHYMFFDSDSGDVYIHHSELGAIGTNGSGTLMFDASVSGHIVYDSEFQMYGLLSEELADFPVVGVTWYGALKYCNWLTVSSGFPSNERAYREAPSTNLGGWHPVVISDESWETRDLTDLERGLLLNFWGFRLPMDDAEDESSGFNEWLKSAAWDSSEGAYWVYGFGADAITSADANYWASGDPFESGLTPAGFYDGTLYNPGGGGDVGDGSEFQSAVDGNAYGLRDMSGNAWEWLQDKSSSDASKRRNRGGSWRSSTISLRAQQGAHRLADSANDSTGFRVAQSAVDDLLILPFDGLDVTGPWGGEFEDDETGEIVYTLGNMIDDPIAFSVDADVDWLSISDDSVGGEIPAGGEVHVTVAIDFDCGADGLIVGDNVGTIEIVDVTHSILSQRQVIYDVTEPLDLTPAANYITTMQVGGVADPSGKTYELENSSIRRVNWSVEWVETEGDSSAEWLTINGEQSITEEIVAGGTLDVVVAIAPDVAAGLATGDYAADVTLTDECTGQTFTRQVVLTVVSPIGVVPEEEQVSSGPFGGPFDPAEHVFSVTNLVDEPTNWTAEFVESDPWMELDEIGGTLQPEQSVDVTASFIASANALPLGEHILTLRFTSGDFVVDRTIKLDVTEMDLVPEENASFSGPLGGPFAPDEIVYTLTNEGEIELNWSASLDPEASWLDIYPQAGVILDPDGTAEIALSITSAADLLPTGEYSGTLTITDLITGAVAVREVELVVGGAGFRIELVKVQVEEEDDQPGGPEHLFRIGKYEITNDEYVRFLNSIYTDPGSGFDEFVMHDTVEGVVRLKGDGTVLFDAGIGNLIGFDDGAYVADAGFEDHPVSGVSWYGAVAFCNWLTWFQGMDSSHKIYTEGDSASGWHSVGMNEEIILLSGYRLPMDDGALEASLYSEYYKAAAWSKVSQSHSVYGFGRDTIENADANFLVSGDPFEIGSSPVGYYNGVNKLADEEETTRNTQNAYGLFDLTGNVSEWMHDQGDLPVERGVRGGHYQDSVGSLTLRADNRESLPAAVAYPFVGFRIAQAYAVTDLQVTPELSWRKDAYVGDDLTEERVSLYIHNPGFSTIDNMTISTNVSWLKVDGVAPTQVPPHGTGEFLEVVLAIQEDADTLNVSPAPPGSYKLVRAWGADTLDPEHPLAGFYQPGGPEHDYWIGSVEVTNAEYLSFLNNAYSLAVAESEDLKAAYLHFDTDTGVVYVNDQEQAEVGPGPPEGDSVLIYDATVGRITFDAELGSDGEYTIEDGYSDHPVVGVSWYGAAKYCNWLARTVGQPDELISYSEGINTDLHDWAPRTAQQWDSFTFAEADRTRWISETIGYRLPMDFDYLHATPGLFAEWYKAAAWDLIDEVDHVYGFGRDDLEPVDANYWQSGDTEEDDTTRIRFFNGTNKLDDDETLTVGTDNSYTLYDMTGNVAEWTNDFFESEVSSDRSIRGGSWRDEQGAAGLRADTRGFLAPDLANDSTGFRIVRGTGHVGTVTISDNVSGKTYKRHFILDLHECLAVTPHANVEHEAIYGADLVGIGDTFTITNLSGADSDWEVTANKTWIDLVEVGEGAPPAIELNNTLLVGESTEIEAKTNDGANDLPSGEHVATITFKSVRTGRSGVRTITLKIEEPIVVTNLHDDPQEFTGYFGGPFDLPHAERDFEISNQVAFSLGYSVSANVDWLDVESTHSLSGSLLVDQTLGPFSFNVNSDADTLSVGKHAAKARFAWSDPLHPGINGVAEVEIELVVEDPIVVSSEDETWLAEIGDSLDYTIANNHISDAIALQIGSDQDWITIGDEQPVILAGGVDEINVSINENAELLYPGEYEAIITFTDTLTGEDQTRDVTLSVGTSGSLTVLPPSGLEASGQRAAGPFVPFAIAYELLNGSGEGGGLNWSAYCDPEVTWLTINGGSTASGTIAAGESVHLLVEIDEASASALAASPDAYTTALTFDWLGSSSGSTTRQMSLLVGAPELSLYEQAVLPSSDQPGGPAYTYLMGTYHTTNDEFVTFLNDVFAEIDSGGATERSSYVFFDTTTGDVYVNNALTGETAADPGERETLMFSPEVTGQIVYVGGGVPYEAAVGYGSHPVTGVSWYGAIKYCNWLTLDQAMLPSQRCYAESTDQDLAGWRPLTCSSADWADRDLNDSERLALVSSYRGYRLPMDEGYNNSVVTSDEADDYNEWFKAAAWNDELGTETVYGFGRNSGTGADMNYKDSGDPFDNGSTPVGYYDGTLQGGSFQTNGNDNSFGIWDMSGNAYQWIQGRFNTHSSSITFRTLRGGSWDKQPAGSLSCEASVRTFAPPSLTNSQIGFRVVRTLVSSNGDFDGSGTVDVGDFVVLGTCLSGPGEAIRAGCEVFDLDYDQDIDLADFVSFQIAFDSEQ